MHHQRVATILLVATAVFHCNGYQLPKLSNARSDPDYNKDSRALILSRGFGYQEHQITTRDGYILTCFRIVHPSKGKEERIPVLLVHGLMSSSRDFLVADPFGHVSEGTNVIGNNLGFELAKRGYDVWLLNCRGNTYSQNHTEFVNHGLDVNPHPGFWHFSYQGIAEQDVPAAVAYVLDKTDRDSIAYIGHSRGTQVMFASLSMYPWLNEVIKPAIALSPITTVSHMTGVSSILTSPLYHILMANALPVDAPFAQLNSIPENLKLVMCSIDNGLLCGLIMRLGLGDSPSCFNLTRMPVFFSRSPAGSSAMDMRKYSANALYNRFGYNNHGILGNLIKYGKIVPPQFDLESITNKEIYLIYGKSDSFSDKKDLEKLKQKLDDRIRESIPVNYTGWGHGAMLFSHMMGQYVITDVLRILDLYE
jgi:pimeloyl-ACP methyl ester carboxylesterase